MSNNKNKIMTTQTNKINKVLLLIVIVLAAVLVGIVYWQKVGFKKSYWAVYLDTGDLYFGQLSFFPKFSLKDAYLLQKNVNDQQNPYSVSKFSNAFWGPEDRIYLNKDNVIWKAKLKDDSQVVNFIQNPQTTAPQNQQNQTTQPPVEMIPVSTSTTNAQQ